MMLSRLFKAKSGAEMKVLRPRSEKVVTREAVSMLAQRGWSKVGRNHYTGVYATVVGTWKGEIERAGDRWRVRIYKPPKSMTSKHPKRGCFHEDTGGWWRINLHTEPVDNSPDAIIVYVEKVLNESHLA